MSKATITNPCSSQTGIVSRSLTKAVFSFNQKEKIMKHLSRLLIISVVIFTALFTAAPFSMAQDYNREVERERLKAVMSANANIEEFRTEMFNYLTEFENVLQQFEKMPAVRGQFDKDGLDPLGDLRKAKASLAELSPDDLVRMRAVYARFSNWREAPRVINSTLNPDEKMKQQRVAGKKGGGAPNVITPDACPDLSGTPSFADIAITDGFLIAADAVMEAFPTDGLTILARLIPIAARTALEVSLLVETTLRSQYDDCHGLSSSDIQTIVDGAKTEIINNDNTNATNTLNSISSATTTITNNDDSNKTMLVNNATANTTTITNAVTSAKNEVINNDNSNKTMITTAITDAQVAVVTAGDANSAAIINNDNSNKTMIVNNDNSNAATLNTNLTNAKNTIIANDNTNTTNIVNNDNANKTMIINNSNANTMALNDLILRAHIEADLSSESSAVKVAWFMTPTANGGKLDLVQQIVTLTLANIVAAGGSVGNAQSFLDQANADKAAGNFKSAYDNYRKAYKAAVN